MLQNRCAPRVTAQAGIVGPPTLRLHPRTPACPPWARGLLSAQRKTGYHGPACQGPRHSSEDFSKDQALQAWRASRGFSPREGPLLERTSRMLLQILLRTRLSKPGEPREGPLLERAPQGCRLGFCQGPSGASRGPQASRGFLPREAISAPAAERTWDDVRGAIVILVLKAVNKAAPSQEGLRPRHFRDKENACPTDVTVGRPTDLCSANHRPAWTVAF